MYRQGTDHNLGKTAAQGRKMFYIQDASGTFRQGQDFYTEIENILSEDS
jgi:hypothetical protein